MYFIRFVWILCVVALAAPAGAQSGNGGGGGGGGRGHLRQKIQTDPACNAAMKALAAVKASVKGADKIRLARDGLKRVPPCKNADARNFLNGMLTSELGLATIAASPSRGAALLRKAQPHLNLCVAHRDLGPSLAGECQQQNAAIAQALHLPQKPGGRW